jgi:hypothetical protein
VFDWGCGGGVAARRVISFCADHFDELTVWDHSPLAADFAQAAAARTFPAMRVGQATPGFIASSEAIGLLVISHVLNDCQPKPWLGCGPWHRGPRKSSGWNPVRTRVARS